MDSLRESFVVRAKLEQESFAELCREFGISRKTGYKWVERYLAKGRLGLRELSRRPDQTPLSVASETVAEIVRIRGEHRTWGARKIRELLRRAKWKEEPSERTVNRVLQRCGLIAPQRRVRHSTSSAASPPRAKADRPNALWTVDYKGWWRAMNFDRCEPLTVRDAYSRFVLAMQVMPSTRFADVQNAFDQLFRFYGLPEAILSDNGSPFASSQNPLGLTRLSAWWVALGIEHHRSRPATPSDNGAHERMHKDIAAEVEVIAELSRERQQAACDHWRHEFNNVRPHEALGMKTPAEVYTRSNHAYGGRDVELVYPETMLTRHVSRLGHFKYKQRHIFVSKSLAGWTIGLEPQRGGSHTMWFSHRRVGAIDLTRKEAKVIYNTESLDTGLKKK